MRRCCSIFLYAVLLFLSPGRVKSFPAAGIFGGQRGGSLLRQRTNRFRSAAITLGVGLLGLGGATVYIYSCALSAAAQAPNSGPAENLVTSHRVEMLKYTTDYYDGVIIDEASLPENMDVFKAVMQTSLKDWKALGKKGVWLKVPAERSDLVPVSLQMGFELHHAEKTYIMLSKWLPDTKNMLPPNASHQVGVGALVLNDKDEVLVVKEKNGPLRGTGIWKLPTGLIDAGENIPEAAAREVKEETGVETEFVSVLAMRHAHGRLFGKSDMFFIVHMRLKDGLDSSKLLPQASEIEACRWMSREQMMEENKLHGRALLVELNGVIEAYVSSLMGKVHMKTNREKGVPSGASFAGYVLEGPRKVGGPSMLYNGRL